MGDLSCSLDSHQGHRSPVILHWHFGWTAERKKCRHMFRNCRTVSKWDCSHENKQVLEEANKPCTAYNFRRSNIVMVPRFNSPFLKNSVSYRAAILWNAVSTHFTNQFTVFIAKWRRTLILKNLILAYSQCPGTTKILNAFNYFMFYIPML